MMIQNLPRKLRAVGVFVILLALAFIFSRTNYAKAQSTSTAPSGTYVCLTNSNMSGYVAKMTRDTSGTSGVNQMFTLIFDSATPNQVRVGGLVSNVVSHFEDSTAASTSTTATQANGLATLTANSPTQYIYKMVASSGGVTDYYIGVTNNGNSLLFMSAPTNTSTMNGACQKV